MTQLRRVLVPVTVVWLACQAGAVALAPVASWITAADPHATECTCGHGPGAMCPMHHKPAGRSVPCAIQAADGAGTAVLTTLVGAAGLITEPGHSIQPPVSTGYFRAGDVHVVGELPVPPDPPPPRA